VRRSPGGVDHQLVATGQEQVPGATAPEATLGADEPGLDLAAAGYPYKAVDGRAGCGPRLGRQGRVDHPRIRSGQRATSRPRRKTNDTGSSTTSSAATAGAAATNAAKSRTWTRWGTGTKDRKLPRPARARGCEGDPMSPKRGFSPALISPAASGRRASRSEHNGWEEPTAAASLIALDDHQAA
jgi:hypothetical protein